MATKIGGEVLPLRIDLILKVLSMLPVWTWIMVARPRGFEPLTSASGGHTDLYREFRIIDVSSNEFTSTFCSTLLFF